MVVCSTVAHSQVVKILTVLLQRSSACGDKTDNPQISTAPK